MRSTRLLTGLVLAGLFLTGGCAKLNLEKTFELKLGEDQTFTVDAIKRDQTIKVSVSATNGPVDVFVYLAQDEAAAEKSIFAKTDDNLLAQKRATQEANLEATIPASQAAVVRVVSAGKSATVKLKITN